MFRMQKRKQQRDRDCLNLRLLQLPHESFQLAIVERLDHLTRSNNTFFDAQSQFVGNERRRLDGVEIVELRPCLATNNKHVLESPGGDQCDAGATALQQCISANSRAVNDFDCVESRTGFSADTHETLLDSE